MDRLVRTLIDDLRTAENVSNCVRRPCAARAVSYEKGDVVAFNGSTTIGCTGVKGGCGCEHAELRLIMLMLTPGVAARGVRWELLTSLSPCTYCAHLIVASRLFYRTIYLVPLVHDMRGTQILRAAGIEVCRA